MENLKHLFGKLIAPVNGAIEVMVSSLSIGETAIVTVLSVVVGTGISVTFVISGKNAVFEIGGSMLAVLACMVVMSTLIKVKNKRAA